MGKRRGNERVTIVLVTVWAGAMLVCSGAPGVWAATTSYSVSLSPAPVGFGSVAVGSAATRKLTVTNPGSKKVILGGVATTGTPFLVSNHPVFPYTLNPGTSVSIGLKFSPSSAGAFSGTATVRYKYPSNGSWYWTSRRVQMSGTGVSTSGTLSANPGSLSFGTVPLGASKSLSETVTNSGSAALTISQITASGSGYAYSGVNPPVTLSPGQNVSLKVSFTPAATGTSSGKISISSNASNPLLPVALSGTGAAVGQLSVSPASASFGNVVVGTAKSQAATMTASAGSVTISSAKSSGAEFSVAGLKFPFTLNAGQSASYSLVFSPTSSGSAAATITWVSNATNSVPGQSLTGTGTTAAAHSVSLTWRASTSSNVVGYDIYRATTSGGPYIRINSAVDTTTQDTDYSVTAGQTYFYVVTAVNSAGLESTYSNQIKAVIPYP